MQTNAKNKTDTSYHLSKLHWACRRGMLELDLLLNNFLKHGYPQLSEKDKTLFEQLLNYDDQTLFALLLSPGPLEQEMFAQLTARIRQYARFGTTS